MKTNATIQELEDALAVVNKKYDNNIVFKRQPTQKGKQYIFTLKVKDSKKAGHRLGYPDYKTGKQRRFPAACWHVHGDFFDALFNIRNTIFIWSGGKRITVAYGNWQDKNIGSVIKTLYHSEACECEASK